MQHMVHVIVPLGGEQPHFSVFVTLQQIAVVFLVFDDQMDKSVVSGAFLTRRASA